MKHKVFLKLFSAPEYQYEIIEESVDKGTKYHLIYRGSGWDESVVNLTSLSIIDHGNGLTIDRNIKHVDYSLSMELYILLSHINKGCGYIESSEVKHTHEL